MSLTLGYKYALNYSDQIFLIFFANPSDYAIYTIITNYASLPTRLLQPIEESARISFAQIGEVIKSLDLKISNPSGRDISSSIDKKNALVEGLKKMILKLLGLMYFIGHILFVFAPYYTRVFMKYIPLFEDGLNSEEEEIQSMAIYFFCVSLTVCNGIPEAFVESIAPIDLFGTMNFSLVLSSVIFFLSFPFLYTSFGIRGVIIAKCFSLLLSALLNLRFISSYFSQHHSLPPLTISIYLKKIKIFPTEPMLIKMLGNSSAAYAGDGIIFDHIVIGE
jgi:hypothetical protein